MNKEVKDKAIEWFNTYKKYYDDDKAKEKAHNSIDWIIKTSKQILNTTSNPTTIKSCKEDIVFYKEVKIELDKIQGGNK